MGFAIWLSSMSFAADLNLDADELDEDGSGGIDRWEFEALLYKMGKVPRHIDLPRARVLSMWNAAGGNRHGSIDFEHFIVFHRKFFSSGRSGFEDSYKQQAGLAAIFQD